jgi:hypothetical protein
MKRLALAWLLLGWVAAHAAGQTAVVSWTAATGFTDGTSFTAAEQAAVETFICWAPVTSTGARDNGCQTVGPGVLTLSVHIMCGQVEFTAYTMLPPVGGYNGPEQSAPTSPVLYDTGLQCLAAVSGAKVTN